MIFSMPKREPPLHRAVIDNDPAKVRSLIRNTKIHEIKNALEFDPLEIAHFLGRREIVKILDPSYKPLIKVLGKNEHQANQLNEKKFQEHFGVGYRSHLYFTDYSFFKETLNNCPWILKKSFLGEENREQGWTYRHQLYSGYKIDLTIKWISEELGYGAFTNIDLKSGDFIGEFTGKVRRLYRRKPDHNEYCFHYPTKLWSLKYTVIDALEEGNEMRFINHSDHPNLQPICLCERNLLHVVFVAKTDIKAGSQLTYDYGKDFWKHRKKIDI